MSSPLELVGPFGKLEIQGKDDPRTRAVLFRCKLQTQTSRAMTPAEMGLPEVRARRAGGTRPL